MEMQFYPSGWVSWPAGISCDPTKWCAALNIDSLSDNPVAGQNNNPACAADDCFGANNTPPCAPANFYPFFSIRKVGGQCVWQLGNHIPGSSNGFHQNSQYGSLVQSSFTAFGGGGSSLAAYFNFRQIFSHNPCPA